MADPGSFNADTRKLGGSRHIAEELQITAAAGWQDQICGQMLDGYRLIVKLGQGGMGSIYKAEQMSLKRVVALKMLSPLLARNETYLDRFISEAKAVARINHPNLVQIFDVGSANGVFYFSMEYIEGENVGKILERAVIPPQIGLEIVIPIVSALGEAHANGIVHRDVKPDNIMIGVDGMPKLADLGIAKVEDPMGQGGRRTETGTQLGTPRYMSPEQAKNPTQVDGRADIYSLGATFFHMVTGRPPYEGNNAAMVLRRLATEPVPVAAEFNPEVPYGLSLIISRMMAKQVHERFQDPQSLYAAMMDFKEGKESTDHGSPQPPALAQSEHIRIEAPQVAEQVELRFADEEDEDDDDDLYGGYKPKVSRPGRDQSESGHQPALKRPPRPGATPRPQRPASGAGLPGPSSTPPWTKYLYAGLGALGLIIVAVVAIGIIGNDSSEPPEEDPGSEFVKPPPREVKPPPEAVETPEERRERLAGEAFALFPQVDRFPKTVEELDALIKQLEAFITEWEGTEAIIEARIRRNFVTGARDDAVYVAVADRAKAAMKTPDYGAATKVWEEYIAQIGDKHKLFKRSERELKAVVGKSDAETKKLLADAKKLEDAQKYDQAIKSLEDAAARQTIPNRKSMQTRIKALQVGRTQQRRLQAMTLYPPYWDLVTARLGGNPKRNLPQLAEMVALADSSYKDKLLVVWTKEQELEDLRGIAAGWKALTDTLTGLKGKEIELRFIRDAAPKKVKVKSLTGPKIMLASSIKYITQLHPSSMIKLGGKPFEGPEGGMRLAVILMWMEREAEALALFAGGKAHPSYSRYDLRFISRWLSTAKALKAKPRKAEREWLLFLTALLRVYQHHSGSIYEPAFTRSIEPWLKETRKSGPRVSNILRRAKSAQGQRKWEAARDYAMIINRFYPGIRKQFYEEANAVLVEARKKLAEKQ